MQRQTSYLCTAMFSSFALIHIFFVAAVLGHMEIVKPCPRYSPKCNTQPTPPAGQILDFNLNTPIGSGGNIIAPICKYPTPWSQPTETWTAGQSVTVSFVPWGATHGGGHCEFSISYDGGKTFVVVYQVLRTCFFTGIPAAGGMDTVRDYTFTLPANLPGASNAIFAWTWVNAVGNREFYNNCGDIAIKGPAGSYTGKRMTIANYGPGYPVIPEFIGNYNMGIQYYTTNAEQVTVTGNGYTGDTPASTSSVISLSTIVTSDSSTSQTKETTALLTSSVPPSSSTTFISSTTQTPTQPQCTASNEGQFYCSNAGTSAAYVVCTGGKFYSGSCVYGTVCKQSGSQVYCDWA